jgi:hypothetical protein
MPVDRKVIRIYFWLGGIVIYNIIYMAIIYDLYIIYYYPTST